MNVKIKATLLVLGVSIIFVEPAWAYLDPGTGSMIIQGLIAGITGGIVVLRLYWAKVKSFFAGSHEQHDSTESADDSA